MLLKIVSSSTKFCLKTISTSVQKTLHKSYNELPLKQRLRTSFNYAMAACILTAGLTYAAVPMYRLFCQEFNYGGTVSHNADMVSTMEAIKKRLIKIRFVADKAASMAWNFTPQQPEIHVFPGETALAFYTATNPTDEQICGISTYNVVPYEAGQYFNKIQCFCFEEQMLNPQEQVEMPVFFYIDPEFVKDPKMEKVKEITLSYTFFEAKENVNIPIPSYVKKVH